jgi:glutamyl-tRNA reductase
VARFQADLQTRDVVPMIIWLKEKMENIRLAEIRHVRGRLGQLSAEQESAIEALTHGIVNKVMHYPISALKNAARDSGAGALLPVVERLFNIPDGDKDQSYRGRNSLTFASTKGEDSSRRVRVA